MITVVSGLPRSGTSLMMQMLVAGGLTPLTDGIRKADANNSRGYFEWEKARTLLRDPGCIAEAEGKVVKVVSTLLPALPATFDYRIVFMQRSLAEVVASQVAMLQKLGTKGSDLAPDAMARALDSHLCQIRSALGRRGELAVTYVEYRELIANPRELAIAIQAFLDCPLAIDTMILQVDPLLYHQRQDVPARHVARHQHLPHN